VISELQNIDAINIISIHAAHAGSDLALLFLLRLTQISIHAAHTGSDIDRNTFKLCDSHFNPRCPYGQRLCSAATFNRLSISFQSTLPIRAATAKAFKNPLKPLLQLLFYHNKFIKSSCSVFFLRTNVFGVWL
jgi:hypothetical protein